MIAIPSNKLFCDTSFFYAAIDPQDVNHKKAKEVSEICKRKKIALYCTRDIIVETITLLLYRFSYLGAIEFIKNVKPKLNIIWPQPHLDTKAEIMFEKMSKDHKLSYCDIVSYIVVKKILDDIPCASFDRDFRTLGLTVIT
ncbi:MAG: type II toxin-antitoxin system VapC family toxin [bacterium]